MRESEGFVVASKPGNAGGAKGPCRECCFSPGRRDPLGQSSHYGTSDNSRCRSSSGRAGGKVGSDAAADCLSTTVEAGPQGQARADVASLATSQSASLPTTGWEVVPCPPAIPGIAAPGTDLGTTAHSSEQPLLKRRQLAHALDGVFSGKPDAGNPLVRFEEGRGFGPAYSTNTRLASYDVCRPLELQGARRWRWEDGRTSGRKTCS
jgi:hypothetical protein